ncbi:type II toxin-antitoxin system HicB family antitoxin [Jiella marina]|uniref:type II toxin-antitoxin system HicB family antitoxin n=1 Tax=Jiella sp. LLJ827 TaxID=2917712 RepID=UPI0021017997|nr:type II toxin-antitoxin system HicB family antitoxin [Jiella sp. LLJ827]MCQ0987937.1 type II toxin-antitoxin system HicB family antitoxin [Jiella sp. LLJ827]
MARIAWGKAALNNIMEIEGQKAVVTFDPEIGMFRGEFIGLSGGADFYATSVDGLREEGRLSLRTYLEMCAEDGIEPFRQFSGRFNVRIDAELHQAAVTAAKAQHKSLNEWVVDAIDRAAREG